jgi:polysaccharide pyruvyl transferase WcaK-like protein
MSKVIWHLGGWSDNFGDRVLQVATTNIVSERYKGDLKFVYIDNQKTYFSECLIEKMNREADMLLVGGGGFIMHRPMDHSHSGWQFNIDTENIGKIDIPIAAYGLGYNKFPYDEHMFPESMWENLQAVIDKSAVFSVRNNGTLFTLEEHGIDTEKVTVVPDPGMFMPADEYRHPCLAGDNIKIGLNWATDRPAQRFKEDGRATDALKVVLQSCKVAADKHDAKIYLIEHLLRCPTNYVVKDELHALAADILGDRVCFTYDELFEDLYPPFDYTAGFFADIYRQMDLTLGVRGHANIIPFGQNTPIIGLGQHNKVKWFMDDVMLGQYLIRLDAKYGYDELISLIDEMLENSKDIKEQMAGDHTRMTYIKDAFVDRIVKLL